MIRTDKRMRICIFLLVCNLAFIWGNSLLPAEVSQAFSDWVKRFLSGRPTPAPVPGSGPDLLRKAAHFLEFASLGFLLTWLMAMLQKPAWLSPLCGITAACIDETIQFFAPNRGPGIRDVLIDSSGVIFGMLILFLGHTYYQRLHNKHQSEE